MKKIVISVMLIMTIAMLAGCGEAEKEPSTTEQAKTTEIEETTGTVSEEPSTTETPAEEVQIVEESSVDEELLPEVYHVALKSIWVNVPDWKKLEYGYTRAFVCIEDGDEFVSVTAEKDGDATTLEDAHEQAFACFVNQIDNQTYVNEMDNITYTNETINGIDVYKYEGTYQSGKDYVDKSLYRNCYIIGYSFISDGIPCTINGVLDDDEQNPDQIAELKEIVEAMMLTVRNEQ